jgi:lipopolysaccharide/colanic/teichoic acid biosynthesis glycosyltransferase
MVALSFIPWQYILGKVRLNDVINQTTIFRGDFFDVRQRFSGNAARPTYLDVNGMNRKTELAIAFILAIVLLPFFLVASVIVGTKLGSPVFFVQKRAGKNGRCIRIVKLRTMRHQPDVGPPLPDAERVTPATDLLRRLRLDELPQLIAVLRGDLALVGPRPLLRHTIEAFGAEGEQRCKVRPGITGWSQVSGNTRLSNDEKLRLDLWYVANRSTALDFRILAETASVALFGERRRPERLIAAKSSISAEPTSGSQTS